MNPLEFGFPGRFSSRCCPLSQRSWALTCILLMFPVAGCSANESPSASASPAKENATSTAPSENGSELVNVETPEQLINQQEAPPVQVDDQQLQDLIDSLGSNYFAVRLESLEKLGKVDVAPGSAASQGIVEALIRFRAQEFNDFEDQYADQALAALGDVALVELKRLGDSQELRQISKAATMMRALGGKHLDDFRPVLDKWFQSEDNDHHWAALFVLEGIGPPAKVYLDQLKQEIQAEDFQVQQIALRALASIGPDAYPLLSEVRALADEGQNISVQSHAMIAMGHLAAGKDEAPEVAEQLMGYLDAFNFVLKERALTGLIALGPDAKAAAPKAKDLMENDTTGLAAHAAYLFGVSTGQWKPAIERLQALTSDFVIGYESIKFLRRAGAEAKPATDLLLRLTLNSDESISSLSVQTLSDIYAKPQSNDPQFQKVVQRFQQLAQSEMNETSYIAAQQIEKWKAADLIDNSSSDDESGR